METYLSQPVTRQSVFLGRTVALLAWLVVMTGFILIVQLASDAVVGLQIDTMRVASTVVLCGLLALLFGTLALAIAGWLPRPPLVLSVGIAVAVGGYLVAALFPLSDPLDPDERAVALEVGFRRRPARQFGRAMAVCGSDRARCGLGHACRGRVRPAGCASRLRRRRAVTRSRLRLS